MSSVDSSPVAYVGSISRLRRVGGGRLLKTPAELSRDLTPDYEEQVKEIAHNFHVERKILEYLGDSPRTMKQVYHGWQEDRNGLLLSEASHGNLQDYLDDHGPPSRANLPKWSRQIVQCLRFIHGRGVIHCDIRPENFLIHQTSQDSLDIRICDFGGSVCKEIGVDGLSLPTPAFLDPNYHCGKPTRSTDIFSLGFVLYFIQTGHWPYRGPGSSWRTREEADEYEERVQNLYTRGQFPDTEDLFAGHVMRGCWTKRYKSAIDIICDLDFDIDMLADSES
ncbi:kinase-like domain-containing protein [Thelonectria olida]|uniref:EKC/KEOPS complex subunit BUD32 n=1 Tax=Thelonectria olida TaxID=1576542 RepID=A0A9P8WA88_9HYPO|nr:kinase-like domain-containing protein [Thelonectria olida]